LGEERKGAFVGRVVEVLATEGLEAFFFSLWREGVVEIEDAVWCESEAGLPRTVVEEEEEEEESGSWCKQRDEDGRIRDNICRYYYSRWRLYVFMCVRVDVGVNESRNASESESESES
jgi:hypothetical protein